MLGYLIVIALTMLVVDLPWLMWSKQFWVKLPGVSADGMRPLFGIPVYLAMAYLFTYAKSIGQAALIGLSTYAVFDGTNAVMFEKYPLWLGAADTLWGGFLFTAVYWLKSKFVA
jgi:uncharacterized membrane protein